MSASGWLEHSRQQLLQHLRQTRVDGVPHNRHAWSRGAETSHDSLSISQKDKVLWARARGSSSATSLLGARLGRPRHTSDPKHTVRQQSKTSALDAQPVGQGQLSVLCSSFSMKAGDMARAVNFLLAKDSTVARSIR